MGCMGGWDGNRVCVAQVAIFYLVDSPSLTCLHRHNWTSMCSVHILLDVAFSIHYSTCHSTDHVLNSKAHAL